MKERFAEIYKHNQWGGNESKSDPGSGLNQTVIIREGIESIFKIYNIKSILDIPCGDFNWMKEVNLSGIRYIGADIVEDIIQDCSKKYSHEFQVMDITLSDLPKVDLIFSRDCFVHLPYIDIHKSLENVRRSGSKYFLSTSFTHHINIEGKLGGWRPINLQSDPFNLPDPLLILNEGRKGSYIDKSIILWEIEKMI